jgi:transcriptional regulator
VYIPEHFREERPEVLQAFIARHPLGALVAMTAEGLTANHIPMSWHARTGTPGTLHGHVAKANPIWRALAPDAPVLVVFTGANRYLSPSWYPAKKEHGKVVPTWNYAVVHAHGTIRFLDDRHHAARNVASMTDRQERSRPEPWQVSDAPASYIEPMLERIVGFEIAVTRLVGKFKASQHRPENERRAVAAALAAEGLSTADIDEIVRAPARHIAPS